VQARTPCHARLPDGTDTDDAAADWAFATMPTPGGGERAVTSMVYDPARKEARCRHPTKAAASAGSRATA
jgi:hypothetical protein